jgi:hypothetical protein
MMLPKVPAGRSKKSGNRGLFGAQPFGGRGDGEFGDKKPLGPKFRALTTRLPRGS